MKISHLMSAALIAALSSSCEKSKETSFAEAESYKPLQVSAFENQTISSGQLKGLYINAGDDSPIVLIVPGSGPTDLDGNNPMGVKAGTYKKLAESLAGQGISSVRVDKHGMFSSQAAGDPNAVTVESYAMDYKNWAETIKTKTGQSCVYMLGHSEGGIMVSAASVGNPNVCGLILISAPGRSFGNILREQLKANPANKPILEQAFGAIEAFESGETVGANSLHPGLRPLFNSSVQGFMTSIMAVEPAQLAKAAETKTLIVQGDNDIQVSVEDANKLAEATGGELVILKGVNHVLKDAPKSRSGNMKTYSNPDLPVSPEVVEVISNFINQGQ